MKININPFKPVNFKESSVRKVVETSGAIASVKYDGVRAHLVIKPTADIEGKPAARLYAMSRTNKLIPALRGLFISLEDQLRLGQFLSESVYPEGLILDGEMLVKGVDFHTGAGLLRRKTLLKPEELQYMVYGVLPLKDVEEDSKTDIAISYTVMSAQVYVILHQLIELLNELEWYQEETYEVYNMESLQELYEDIRSKGHEGLIVKDPMTPYKRGKKTGYWKMKSEETIDGEVIGINWGTVGLSNEGKVIGFQVLLESGRIVDANNATQFEMSQWTYEVNKHGEDYFNGWQVEIKFMEKTPEGSLRHPSFLRWRGLEDSPTIKS